MSLWFAISLLIASVSVAAAAPLEALVGSSGGVDVREGDRVVASIRPGIFESGWQFRAFGPAAAEDGSPSGGEAGAGGGPAASARHGADISISAGAAVTARGELKAAAGATVVSRGSARASDRRLEFEYILSTDRPISVNSVHVSVSVPSQHWAGARWTIGGREGIVPVNAGAAQIASEEASAATLARGQERVRIEAQPAEPIMLQDNRFYSPGGDLELRIGRQDGSGWTWKPDEPQVIAFAIDLGRPIAVEREHAVTLAAGSDWVPLDLKLDIAPGSALDFSFLNDAPAGKHGRVIATRDGHFAFADAPDHAVRFYGVNLCFSANYPTHAEADRVAERLARIGYNTVRIHHYEGQLTDPNAPDSLTFRPDSLDRLDYLFAALKKRGIYMKTDLFVSRPIRPDEAPGDFKMATLVSDRAMANWKAFARKLLDHVNPYTGLAYKDDPALAWLSMVNEPNAVCYLGDLKGELLDLFQQRWAAWLRERYGTDGAVAAAWGDPAAALSAPMPRRVDPDARGRDLGVFLATLHERAYAEMSGYLHREIGTHALLTYLNGWAEVPAFMDARTAFDWVDNHFYWDHPRFLEQDWRLPSEGGSGGGSAIDAGGAGPDFVAMTRLYGKPFSVSEYNYAAPNRFRAESGLLMGSAAAIQGWDAVWRFAYSHSEAAEVQPTALDYFNMACDPAQAAAERAALLLFLRRDASTSAGRVTATATHDDLILHPQTAPIPSLGRLALITRVGVSVSPRAHAVPPPAAKEVRVEGGTVEDALRLLRQRGLLAASNASDPAAGAIESETGQVRLSAKSGTLEVNTPRTAGGVARAGGTLNAGPLTARIEGARAAVWVSSLDGQPIERSRHLLLVHVTDVQNTGARYASQEMRVLEEWGRLPHLARAGSAAVTLKRAEAAPLRAWRLDTSGRRLASVPVKTGDRGLAVDLSTRDPNGAATLYYEVAQK